MAEETDLPNPGWTPVDEDLVVVTRIQIFLGAGFHCYLKLSDQSMCSQQKNELKHFAISTKRDSKNCPINLHC